MNRQRFLAALVISAVFSVSRADEVNPLAGYAADITQTTISGLSSGAFMTTQLHVAYSRYFSGAAIIAGGPYYCAGS
ncbi:MAG: hypothetical protein L0Y39_12560, partial [Methylococcaceae bacterium]|nr:hypothetical protein [Methylococcaceae bacterium]